MYLKKEENQIRKLERESFRKLKKQENGNKKIPVSDDILYISDFTLQKFTNSCIVFFSSIIFSFQNKKILKT